MGEIKRRRVHERFVEAENHAVTAATSAALANAIEENRTGKATHKCIKTSFGFRSADCQLEQRRSRTARYERSI